MFMAHISDLHISVEDKLGISNLHKVIRCINNLEIKPELVMVTGDLTQLRHYKNYQACFDELNQLKMPYFVITGNHDESKGLMKALDEFCPQHPKSEMSDYLQYVVDDYPVRIIALDSFKLNTACGELNEAKLEWLKNKLENNPQKKPVVIMVHQFTLKTKLSFFDGCPEEWFLKFNKLVAEHKDTVKLIACGHLHNSLISNIDTIPMVSSFSTNWQAYFDFKPREYLMSNKLPVGFYLHRFAEQNVMSYVVSMSKEECELAK